MTETRLNSVTVSHIHRERLDTLDITPLLRDLASTSELRRRILESLTEKNLLTFHCLMQSMTNCLLCWRQTVFDFVCVKLCHKTLKVLVWYKGSRA